MAASSAADPAVVYDDYNPAVHNVAQVRQLLLDGRLNPDAATKEGCRGVVAITSAGHLIGVLIYMLEDTSSGQLDLVRRHGVAVSPPWRNRGIGQGLIRAFHDRVMLYWPKRKIMLWPVPPQPGDTQNIREYHRKTGYKSDSENDWFMSKKPVSRRRR